MSIFLKILTSFLIVILLPYTVWSSDEFTEQFAVLASFALIDFSQSSSMFYENTGYYEVNALLGPFPSREELLSFGIAGLGLTYLVSAFLPAAWSGMVIDSIIATERLNIEDNRRVYRGWNDAGPPARGRSMAGIPILISMRF